MRQSILDNNLEIDGTHSQIVNPMQLYQEAYGEFATSNCVGGSQSLNTENLKCNVKRTQMVTLSKQIASALDSMPA